MSETKFPPIACADWTSSQSTLQGYAKVLGKIRRALTPPQRHWGHVSLRVASTGLTTTAIPAGPITFEMILDLTSHALVIITSRGEQWRNPLTGQSVATFCEESLNALAGMGIHPKIDRSLFADTSPGPYHTEAVKPYWQAMSQIDNVFKQFKGPLRGETSDVQLWPHHIDLAVLWFSGRLVPGVDPTDEESSDEQMNFGFSPGDEGIPEPYFYITAYPLPDGLPKMALPDDVTWHTDSFIGALLRYDALVTAPNPAEKLLDFLDTVQRAGAGLMK